MRPKSNLCNMENKKYDSRGTKMLGMLGITLQKEVNINNDSILKIVPNSPHTTNNQYKMMDIPEEVATNEVVEVQNEVSNKGLEIFLEQAQVNQNMETVSNSIAFAGLLDQKEAVMTTDNAEEETDSEEEPFSSDDSIADPNFQSDESTTSSDSDENPTFSRINEPSTSTEGRVVFKPLQNNEHDIDGTKKKTRKRKSCPTEWRRNKIKLLRNSGQAYTTLNKGMLVEAKQMKMPCNESCILKCRTKFSEEERVAIFKSYWDLADITKQRTFIITLMQEIDPKYSSRKRTNNNAFYFKKDDKKIRVCKVFFVATLGITNRCIRSVIIKRKEGDLEDRRGKHGKQKQVPENLKNDVRAHIESIPKIESHYTRAHSEKQYIEGGKTITDLYRDYKTQCEAEDKLFVTLSMYRYIFNYEFNLAFFVPKKDQCQTCVSYENANDDEKKELETDYLAHQREKKLSREEKQNDKEKISEKYQVSCFDLQATLPTPRGDVSSFYYKSKLSTYNFTVCDLNKKGQDSVTCFMWHEGQGKRGSNEIGSCLLKYLKQKSENYRENDLEIVFYSDNCTGQQKNKFILAAYFYAIANYNIKSITHKFLVSGHTQNEGDNAHSVIEKNIKRCLKSGPIYTPDQYVTLVKTAKKTGTPYTVMELSYEDFFDLKKLTMQTSFNFNKDTLGGNVKFMDASIFKVERENLDRFYYKTSYDNDLDYKIVNIKPKNTRTSITFDHVQLVPAYKDSLPIPKKKHDDLMYLLNSNAIKKCHSHFYNSLKASKE